MFFFFFIPSSAYATTSWLSDYAYRTTIPVNSTVAGAQTDYQMTVTLHSGSGTNAAGDVYFGGHLQDTTTFNDIRFTTSDGTTLKSFWIQSVADETGGRKAVVYVKLDTPASGTTDYYVYYGKASVTNASSYDNTFTKDFGESGLVGLWHMDEQTPGSELLTNGTFESWTGTALDNWTFDQTSAGVRDITKETSIIYAGSDAVKLTATNAGGTGFGLYQDITTVSNQTYQITIQQEFASRTAGTLKIEAYDNTHSTSLASQSVSTTASSYSPVNIRFTSTNTTSVRIKVYLNSETTTGVAYVDSVSVRQSGNTITDSTPNNNTGTIYGAARTDTDGGLWGSTNQQFSTGSALNFDGKDDYVDAGTGSSLNISGAFTMEAWIYPTKTGVNGAIVTKNNNSSGSNGDGFFFRQATANTVVLSLYQTDRTLMSSVGQTLSIGQWNHVVAIYDGSSINVCVNTSCATPVGVTGFSADSSDHLTIGKYAYTPAIYFAGQIDDVRVYNRALSQAEIGRQYSRSKYASTAPTWGTPASEQQLAFAVTSNATTLISDGGATLNGYLSGLGGNSSVNVYFKYGTSQDNLNNSTAPQVLSSYSAFTQAVSGLSPNTTYYFQAVADGSTTATGSILSFTTAFINSDYYYGFTNGNGTLSFTNKTTGATILDSSPNFYINNGATTTGSTVTFTNPSFETDAPGTRPTGWTILPADDAYTNINISSNRASAGSQSLRANLNAAEPISNHRNIYSSLTTISQDKSYTFNIDSYTNAFTAGTVGVYIFYYNTANGSGPEYETAQIALLPTTVGSWQTTTFNWIPPTGALSFKVLFYLPQNDVMDLYLDNFQATEVSRTYVTNSSGITTNIATSGDNITATATDNSGASTTIAHKYELNLHSPNIKYTSTLTYKQNVNVSEERFDFIIPTQSASVMTRDLQIISSDPTATYYSDLYTPKVVKFGNGTSFLGNDTMQSMRLRSSGATNSQLSFYSDYQYDHPFTYFIKNSSETTDISPMKRSIGDSYSSSVTFSINPGSTLKSLVKTRQPYGYDAVALFTNHPDSETLAAVNAVAYGTEDTTSPTYGTKGIVGRGLGWTKGVFVSGQTGTDLQSTTFKTLTDQMYLDGVEIVGHSITPGTDSRSVVDSGMQTLSQYGARDWIDHGASGGVGNLEDLASQGTIKGDPNYSLDLFAKYGYQYAWSYVDFTASNYDLNMMSPSTMGTNPSFFYYNNNVDDNPGTDQKIYLWSTINTNKTPDLYYTNANIDSLISQKGVHIGHEYMAYSTSQNHSWYINGSTNKTEIYPAFDTELAYMATKKEAGQLWSPTMATLGDYLVKSKDVLVTNNSDGTYTVTNNGSSSITGVTLLAESAIQSVTMDGKQLTSFGGTASGHDKQIILPTFTSGQAVTLTITYGTKDTSTTPSVISNDTGKNKVNELTGYWDSTLGRYYLTAEGKHQSYSFTATIPTLANTSVPVNDTTTSTFIGNFPADSNGTITFSATLGSTHTFIIGNYTLPSLTSSSNNSSSSTSAPFCNDTTPTGIPNLFQITATGGSAKLTFTTLSSGITGYNISYGYTPGEERFSTDISYAGPLWTLDTTINSLSPNTTYYFKVRARNGCTAGSWSNNLSVKTLGAVTFNQLEITSSELVPQTNTTQTSTTSNDGSCQSPYTVKSGDSLWNIAINLLGDGNKYKDIIDQNKNTYPSLASSNNLSTGWELKVNCTGNQAPQTGTQQTTATPTQVQGGYDVKVNVVNTNKKPVEGATVTLHSTPQTTKTDKNGVALFHNVEQGDHQVLIAYSGFQGEQSINLTGDVKQFDLNVTVKPQSVLLSPIVIGIVSVLVLVIIILAIVLIRTKKNIKKLSV